MIDIISQMTRMFATYSIDVGPLPRSSSNQLTVESVLSIVFTITGAIALVFLVAGGLRYISSRGDAQEISKAKGTIIYALVGLIVSISAVAIVTFILGRVV